MKKIIVVRSVEMALGEKKNLFSRASFAVFPAATNDEALRIHDEENADLIITNLDGPGIPGDQLCTLIRREKGRAKVSIILVCSQFPAAVKRASQCKANAVITSPFLPETLFEKAVALLSIPKRESFRVLVSAKVEGSSSGGEFLCNLVNISVSGMLIETSRKLSKGDALTCSFYLPGQKLISVKGNIIRVDYRTVAISEYGIRFMKLPFDTKKDIEVFVKAR